MKAEIAEQTIPGELFSLASMFPIDDTMDQLHSAFYCYKAADSDPDTMYHHQAMQQPDREQFRKAMQKEMDDHMADGNFELVQQDKIPIGTKVFPAVWQMRRKRDIKTQEVKKWKARLNFDGSRMRRGEHYNQSYAPVASFDWLWQLPQLTIGYPPRWIMSWCSPRHPQRGKYIWKYPVGMI